MQRHELVQLLIDSTEQMFEDGRPLMSRVLPEGGVAEIWEHYPAGDVVNGEAGSRYFYHSHPPGERLDGEHGHFHLFLDKSAMPTGDEALIVPPQIDPATPRADVVHLAALAISSEGLPLHWFTCNRWVTDEWLYPAESIIPELTRFDLRGQAGDPLVNSWLTAMVGLARDRIAQLLSERDAVLELNDMTGEDRSVEVTSSAAISLERLIA